jgi:drug/metabolite transporter (DMT)-like permease
MEITLKTISGSFNPIQLTLSRFFVGGVVLLPFAIKELRKRNVKPILSDLRRFAFLGFVCVIVSMLLYQMAVINTKASVVAVLFSSNPIFVMILAYFILKEPIFKNNILALVLEIIGIVAIINPLLQTKLSVLDVTFALLAAVSFAVYGVLGKQKAAKFGGVVVTCFSFLFGSFEMLLLSFLTKIDGIANILTANGLGMFANVPLFSGYSPENLLLVLYVFIGITGGGYVFYFLAMEETSANTASLVFFFKPALSPILALILLKEIIPVNMIIGIVFILGGSILSILPGLRKQKHPDLLQAQPIEVESED